MMDELCRRNGWCAAAASLWPWRSAPQPLHWEGEEARVVTLRDVTERRLAEERERELIRTSAAQLRAEHALLRSVVEEETAAEGAEAAAAILRRLLAEGESVSLVRFRRSR